MRTTLIINAFILDHGRRKRANSLIQNGLIVSTDYNGEAPEGAEIVDAGGCLLSYGFADLHVHLRVPGNPEKETILTGSRAAARGGYTTVCAMPNLNPVPDATDTLSAEEELIKQDAVIDVRPYCSITSGRKGEELVDMATLKARCAAFSDDGSGVQDGSVMLRAMDTAAREDCIIAAHCEDTAHPASDPRSEWIQIERDLKLCETTGCHYHVCHISCRESVELIRAAKARGVNVTCETAPHYLLLCKEDVLDEGRFRMNPPIRTADDREALVEGLKDGTIDAIATDHAPHTAEEKSKGFAGSLMGVVGLETAFPVLYTGLVLPGIISLERILEALSARPRRIFRLGGALQAGERADLCLIDTGAEYRINSDSFLSKGHSTPFDGMKVRGKIVKTFYNGYLVYDSAKEETGA